MRETNRAVVLDILRHDGSMTRSELACRAALAKPTVSEIIVTLLDEGLVREIGPAAGRSRGGPRGRLLALNPEVSGFIGIHLGVRQTFFALADALGHIRVTKSFAGYRADAARALRELPELVLDFVREANLPLARIAAIGIAVPGLVNRVTGTCIFAPNLAWNDVPLGASLTEALGVPIAVGNSMQAGGTAEVFLGGHDEARSLAWLYVEDGIGAALITDGRVLYGKHGYTGEIGHWKVVDEGLVCGCGRRGCLETVASGSAIEEAVRTALMDDGSISDRPAKLDAPFIAAAASNGHQGVQGILARAGEYLGVAISHLINFLDPEVVVLDGPIIRASDFLVHATRASVARHSVNPELAPIVASIVGGDVVLKGAVFLAMEVRPGHVVLRRS
jgi:predicted NBD/HSP70 family sugar kinase